MIGFHPRTRITAPAPKMDPTKGHPIAMPAIPPSETPLSELSTFDAVPWRDEAVTSLFFFGGGDDNNLGQMGGDGGGGDGGGDDNNDGGDGGGDDNNDGGDDNNNA